MPRALGVIPARFASTRFPGKPLASLGGCTLLERVWRRAAAARCLARVIVATDDERIAAACRTFGAEAWLTGEHPSGTDRVAEVAARLQGDFPLVVNVQGDEPLLTPSALDRLVEALEARPEVPIATLAEPLEDPDELFDPHVVKVVTRQDGRALYFSRSPIPYYRAAGAGDLRAALAARPGGLAGYLKHQGIYAYRTAALLALRELPPSRLERDEGLEQLRALEAGFPILVVTSDFRSVGVDTPADLERAALRLAQGEG